MKHTILIFSFLLLISCSNKPKPNDEFRKEALAKVKIQKDSLKAFSMLLDKLDDKFITYGEYFKHSHYTIQDSLEDIMIKKYGDNFMQEYSQSEKLQEELYNVTVSTLQKYDAKFKIHKDTAKIAEEITVLNPLIKRYLNKKMNLQMYIPEDNK
ncbi:hypothetical protein V3468_06055 [Flavobacterium oreochromis]|uniref:hypothetical protein n=1 Tax=Flavobacterium oreochromis TaxID=2906078 RepID=UPI00385CF3FD